MWSQILWNWHETWGKRTSVLYNHLFSPQFSWSAHDNPLNVNLKVECLAKPSNIPYLNLIQTFIWLIPFQTYYIFCLTTCGLFWLFWQVADKNTVCVARSRTVPFCRTTAKMDYPDFIQATVGLILNELTYPFQHSVGKVLKYCTVQIGSTWVLFIFTCASLKEIKNDLLHHYMFKKPLCSITLTQYIWDKLILTCLYCKWNSYFTASHY